LNHIFPAQPSDQVDLAAALILKPFSALTSRNVTKITLLAALVIWLTATGGAGPRRAA